LNENEDEHQSASRFMITTSMDRFFKINKIPIAEMLNQMNIFSDGHTQMQPGDTLSSEHAEWLAVKSKLAETLKMVKTSVRDMDSPGMAAMDQKGWRYGPHASKVLLFYIQHLDGSPFAHEFHTGGSNNTKQCMQISDLTRMAEIMRFMYPLHTSVLADIKQCLSLDRPGSLYSQVLVSQYVIQSASQSVNLSDSRFFCCSLCRFFCRSLCRSFCRFLCRFCPFLCRSLGRYVRSLQVPAALCQYLSLSAAIC
jgi:hypothetical protein